MVSTDFDEIDGWECGKRWMPSGFRGLVEYRVLLKFDDGFGDSKFFEFHFLFS